MSRVMTKARITVSDIQSEVEVITSRSGGPGGQHANKVETKIQLRWNVGTSEKLSQIQKELVMVMNASKMTKEGHLIVACDTKRSQTRNKEIALKKLDRLLARAFAKKKVRKATKPTKASRKKRLDDKRRHGEKKEMRRRLM